MHILTFDQDGLHWRQFWLLLENFFCRILYNLLALRYFTFLSIYQWRSTYVDCLRITVQLIFLLNFYFVFFEIDSALIVLIESLLSFCDDYIDRVKLLQLIETQIVVFLIFVEIYIILACFSHINVEINFFEIAYVNVSVEYKQLNDGLVAIGVFFSRYHFGVHWKHQG